MTRRKYSKRSKVPYFKHHDIISGKLMPFHILLPVTEVLRVEIFKLLTDCFKVTVSLLPISVKTVQSILKIDF